MPVDWGALRGHADNQFDLLTRAQCLDAGATSDLLAWRVGSRRWTRLHEGVFLTRPGRDDWEVRATAALLWAQSPASVADAALRGQAAGHLWGLVKRAPEVIELAVPERRVVIAPPGCRVRRVARWDDLVDDVAYPWRTTMEATVLDLAAEGTQDAALAVVTTSVQRELTSAGRLLTELARRPRHRHRGLLTDVLADVADGAQSTAEVRYIRDVERAHGLPAAERQKQTNAGGVRVHDCFYRVADLIVEVDGRLGHERWSDRVRDGQRDRAVLASDGALTTRVFWPDVGVTPCATAAQIGRILQSRGWDGSAKPCRRRDCSVPARTRQGR